MAELTALQGRRDVEFERVEILGTLARAFSGSGCHEDAIRSGDRAFDSAPFSEGPRSSGDAAFWRVRAGRFDEALETLDRTEDLVERVAADFDVDLTRRFRALTRARALLGLGRIREACQFRDAILQGPSNHVLTLGEAEIAVAVGETLDDRLGGVPLVHPVFSRIRARIEYASPSGDHSQAADWARGFSIAELHEKVPY